MSGAPVQGILRQISTPQTGRPPYILSAQEVLMGRDPSCHIILTEYNGVSRHHAAVRPLHSDVEAQEWVVHDLNSANGTYINGQKLQGSQVLQNGDRLTLAENGPEFIFEYQPNQPSNPSSSTGGSQTEPDQIVKIKKGIWVEQDAAKLVIYQRHPTRGRTSQPQRNPTQRIVRGTLIALLLALIGILFFKSIFFPLIFLLLFLATPVGILFGICLLPFLTFAPDVAYTFDLSKGDFTRTRQSLLDRVFNRHQHTRYQLSDITGVRLVKAKYKGDEGTEYDNYNIYLDRVSDKPLALYSDSSGLLKLRDDQETAQQLAELIDEYLYLSRPET